MTNGGGMTVAEYTRLQDDGSPNCPAHVGRAWRRGVWIVRVGVTEMSLEAEVAVPVCGGAPPEFWLAFMEVRSADHGCNVRT